MKKDWSMRCLLILYLARLASAVSSSSVYHDRHDPAAGSSTSFVLTKKIPGGSSSSSSSFSTNADTRTAGRAERASRRLNDEGKTKGRRRAASAAQEYVVAATTTAGHERRDDSTSDSAFPGGRPAQRRRSASTLRRKLQKEQEETVVVVVDEGDEKDDSSSTTTTTGGGEGAAVDDGSVPTENYKTKNPTLFPRATNSPVQSPFAPPPPPPVAPPTFAPITPYVPPPMVTTTTPPAPVPTAYPIRLVLPTLPPAVPLAGPSSSSAKSSMAPIFDNNRQTETISLQDFVISVRATNLDDDTLNERAVVHVFNVDIRKAAQLYLKEALPYENLLYVQLYPLDEQSRHRRRRRRNLLDIAESFQYGGEAVFQNAAPDRGALHIAQQRALNDTKTFQTYIQQTPTLKNVELVEAVPDFKADDEEKKKLMGGKVSLIAVIAVASGMAIAVFLLIIAMVCKLCRRPRSAPLPPVMITAAKNNNNNNGGQNTRRDDEFNPYGGGDGTNDGTDTDDEGARPLEPPPRRLDLPNHGSNVTGETHVVGGTFSSDASEPPSSNKNNNARDTLSNILRTKKRVPATTTTTTHPYTVPVMERADSDDGSMGDSMDGYSLESGRQNFQQQQQKKQQQQQQYRPSHDNRVKSTSNKPSWGSPSTVSVYTAADNESQFSYDNIPGTNHKSNNNNNNIKPSSALGPAFDSDSLDDEMVVVKRSDKGGKKINPTMTRSVPATAATAPKVLQEATEAVLVSSPPYTKGYAQSTPSKFYEDNDEDLSFVVPPLESIARVTKGFEDEEDNNAARDSMPFDESIEDSIEQDLDVFSAELEKIKRDIAARRMEKSSQQSASPGGYGTARWSRR